jgi:hypothetical protein
MVDGPRTPGGPKRAMASLSGRRPPPHVRERMSCTIVSFKHEKAVSTLSAKAQMASGEDDR